MILIHMLSRFKSLLLSLITLFRRALCCFSRRRKSSFSDCEVLTSVNVVQSSNCSRHRNEDERDWNSWDDSPRTVGEHIEQYRQKLAKPNIGEENQEPSVDFFQDMVPKVVKPKKMFIDQNKAATENFSRLQATSAAIIPRLQTAELEDWSDVDNEDNVETGWDEVSDEATKAMIREKRREARAQRHQRLQQQKQQNQTKSGLYAHP
ncbi:uncharacterized protein LOC129570082 [Sitodiplosis mosellana]|uniref:uncharacterized protein LOC129570082 n=1 Tax=Sitodiplosis mosellana TaxID=263140 RepID=UPI002444C3CA|nr:uncharacterized protein LOC129570082 [Sitodiplosis mosellana]